MGQHLSVQAPQGIAPGVHPGSVGLNIAVLARPGGCRRVAGGTAEDDTTRETSPMPVEPTTPGRTSRHLPSWLPSRWFVAAVTAIGGTQLMATMDGMIAVVALPKI